MSEPESTQVPTLETRLAEMDRRLRDIQADLLPEQEPSREGAVPPAGEPAVDRAVEAEPAVDAPVESELPAETPAEPELPAEAPVVPEPTVDAPAEPEPADSVPTTESVPPPQPIPPPATLPSQTAQTAREEPTPAPARADSEAARGRTGPLASILQRGPLRDPSSQQVEVLAELSGRLMGSLRELLAGYEAVVTQARPASPSLPPPAGAEHSPAARSVEALTVSAGPLHDTAALHEFERAMSSLPGVREVSVRSYEGADRAILHVELEQAP